MGCTAAHLCKAAAACVMHTHALWDLQLRAMGCTGAHLCKAAAACVMHTHALWELQLRALGCTAAHLCKAAAAEVRHTSVAVGLTMPHGQQQAPTLEAPLLL
eukprot:1159800-Pelagomonas_calceolata.AAC.3